MSLKLKVNQKDYEAYLKDKPHFYLEQHKSDVTGGLFYKVFNGRTGKEYKLRKFFHGNCLQEQEVDCSCEHFQYRLKGKSEACKHLIYLYEKVTGKKVRDRKEKEEKINNEINNEGGMIA